MLGVYNFPEFKKMVQARDKKLTFEVAFPILDVKQPDKKGVAIEFSLNPDEFLFLRESFPLNPHRIAFDIRMLYESYIQGVINMLLKGGEHEGIAQTNPRNNNKTSANYH